MPGVRRIFGEVTAILAQPSGPGPHHNVEAIVDSCIRLFMAAMIECSHCKMTAFFSPWISHFMAIPLACGENVSGSENKLLIYCSISDK